MSVTIQAGSIKPRIFYRLAAVKRDAAGNEVSRRESELIPNLFTNSGVERLFGVTIAGQSGLSAMGSCVGTGNAAPAITDTLLDSYLASAWTGGSGWSRSFTDNGDGTGYVQCTISYLYAVGLATGNIAEVGAYFNSSAGNSSTVLASRALVVDSMGDPTTFEVLSDEELQLTLYFRIFVDYTDRTQVINVNGVDYTLTIRPQGLGNPGTYWDWPGDLTLNNSSRIVYGTGYALASPTGTSQIVGTGTGAGGDNLTQGSQGGTNAYIPNSKQRSVWMRRPTGATQNIAGLYIQSHHGSWQIGISPSIPKSNLQRFTMTIMTSIDNTP